MLFHSTFLSVFGNVAPVHGKTYPSSLLLPLFLSVSTSWHSGEDSYRAPAIDRNILPTAPRSAREPNVDRSRLPRSPPYTAFLGNLPYDVSEESIMDFFRGLAVRTRSCQNGNCVNKICVFSRHNMVQKCFAVLPVHVYVMPTQRDFGVGRIPHTF